MLESNRKFTKPEKEIEKDCSFSMIKFDRNGLIFGTTHIADCTDSATTKDAFCKCFPELVSFFNHFNVRHFEFEVEKDGNTFKVYLNHNE